MMLLRSRMQLALGLSLTILSVYLSAAARAEFFEGLLPAWPIANVGDPIPEALISAWAGMGDKCPGIRGQFSAFPSKGNRKPENVHDPKVPDGIADLDPRDPDDVCDDGDQTDLTAFFVLAETPPVVVP